MKKLFFFLSLLFSFNLFTQVLAPAADGHILRNQTFIFDQSNPSNTYGGSTTYFNYFQNLYVGGEDTFTSDFDPGDGKATHYNRELRTILEFDISSLNLTPGSFTAFLKITTDGNFWPTLPTLIVDAYDQDPSNQDGTITQSDYSSNTTLLESKEIDALNFNKTYSYNVTSALNLDISNNRDFSGFVLIPNPRNGNEVSFISSWEAQNTGSGKPQLEFTSVQPDISIQTPSSCSTIVGTPVNIEIIVKNLGLGVLNITSVSEIQDSSGYYSLNLNSMDYNLDPQESTSFLIIFSPQTQGSFSATFRISSNDPDENPYDFSLNCQGTPQAIPSIEVEIPSCQNLPTNSSNPLEVKVKNNGNANLIVYSIEEISDSSNVFQLDLSNFSSTIAPANYSTFNIIFTPNLPGSYTGTFRISSNDPTTPNLDFNLNCSAISSEAPDIEVSPSSIYFNNAIPNSPYSYTVTIRNKSTNANSILNLSSIVLSADPVYNLDTSQMKLSLKGGEQTTFKINFLSQLTGVFKGIVSINSNDPDTPTVTIEIFITVTLYGVKENAVVYNSNSKNYIIPASALAYGAYGSRWVTDLKINNPLNKDITFRIFYLPTQTSNKNAISGDFVISPNQTLSIPNVLQVLFGLTEGVGAILIVPQTEGSNLLITSRTYNLTENGTYGQFIKAYPIENFISSGQRGYLLFLQKDSRMRTNVGFVSGEVGASIKVSIFKGDGTFLSSKEKTLAENSHLQINDIFNNFGIEANSNSYALIEVNSGNCFAYASVVSNTSNDPIFIPMY